MKNRLEYITNSRYLSGACLTNMSGGFHNDRGEETVEELRTRENNPYLKAVTPPDIDKKLQLHNQSLSEPFKGITGEDYYDLLDILPPLRMRQDSFSVGEPYYGNTYSFCFTRQGRYLKNLRSVLTSQSELDSQVGRYMEIIDRKVVISKEETSKTINGARLTPYYFSLGGKQPVFACNPVTRLDSKQARTGMVNTPKNLHRSHYQLYKEKGYHEAPGELTDRVSRNKPTLVSGKYLFQYPPGRESVTFIGRIKETSEKLLFQIYDREYFLYPLRRLRIVKKKFAQDIINIRLQYSGEHSKMTAVLLHKNNINMNKSNILHRKTATDPAKRIEVRLALNSYTDNDSLYVGLESRSKNNPECWESYMDITINLNSLPPPHAYVDSQGCNRHTYDFLTSNKVTEPTRSEYQGFRAFRFNPDRLKELAPEQLKIISTKLSPQDDVIKDVIYQERHFPLRIVQDIHGIYLASNKELEESLIEGVRSLNAAASELLDGICLLCSTQELCHLTDTELIETICVQ